MYKEITNNAGVDFIVKTNDDGSESWIPTDPANADYQAYLNKDTLPSNFVGIGNAPADPTA